MREGHGCPGDNILFDTPGVIFVNGRWCHRRPSSKYVNTRGHEIRLFSEHICKESNSEFLEVHIFVTLRISGLGPLEENDTTIVAMISLSVSATRIVAIGFLKQVCLHFITTIRKNSWIYIVTYEIYLRCWFQVHLLALNGVWIE